MRIEHLWLLSHHVALWALSAKTLRTTPPAFGTARPSPVPAPRHSESDRAPARNRRRPRPQRRGLAVTSYRITGRLVIASRGKWVYCALLTNCAHQHSYGLNGMFWILCSKTLFSPLDSSFYGPSSPMKPISKAHYAIKDITAFS